jgi:hypothetical protein
MAQVVEINALAFDDGLYFVAVLIQYPGDIPVPPGKFLQQG